MPDNNSCYFTVIEQESDTDLIDVVKNVGNTGRCSHVSEGILCRVCRLIPLKSYPYRCQARLFNLSYRIAQKGLDCLCRAGCVDINTTQSVNR